MPLLTFVLLTSRREALFPWTFDSLHRECGGDYSELQIIVVDYHADSRKGDPVIEAIRKRISDGGGVDCWWITPKPTVWQGSSQVTKQPWFAASNARNTGICRARGTHIVFVDDLSVLMPGWLKYAREAMSFEGVTLGAYRKIRNMVVENGELISHGPDAGIDCRLAHAPKDAPKICGGGWLFGCSVIAPLEYFLAINGWPECCDGAGYEDCVAGMMLEHQGRQFRFDPRMQSCESEEHHHTPGTVFRKEDKGVSPNDKSHAITDRARNGTVPPNPFNIRELRQHILNGGEFPLPDPNHRDWFDGQPTSEL